jgi:hypothetical protein
MRRNPKHRRQFLAALSAHLNPPAGVQAMPIDLENLDNRAQDVLSKQPNIPKRNLRVEASDGRVTLHGTVHSYYQKQMAQEALRQLEGVQTIDNKIEVSWT